MLFILKFITTVIMLAGVAATLCPRYPGTLIVLTGAAIYTAATDFTGVDRWLVFTLVGLAALAEVGGRLLRTGLTPMTPESRRYAVDVLLGNLGGLLLADMILGPVLGLAVWEMLTGASKSSGVNELATIFTRLAAAALLRFLCATVMLILVLVYLF